MIEVLNSTDTSVFLWLNSFHSEYFDSFMWTVSKTGTWVPMILVLLYILYKKGWNQLLVMVLGIALVVTIADQVSSGLIKHLVERYRPTHNPDICNMVHTVRGYLGGNYGFVSSHAANSFGVALFLAIMFRNAGFSAFIFTWATILTYSRIYLGVHYPGDILGGMCVGFVAAVIVLWLYKWLVKHKEKLIVEFSKQDSKLMCLIIILNMLGVAIKSCF